METTNDSSVLAPNAAFIGFAGTPLIATCSRSGRVDDWRSTVMGECPIAAESDSQCTG